jgi:hypothetical protein
MRGDLSFASTMIRLLRSLLLVPLLLAPASLALAHGGGLPWIWLEQEQVMPGERFHALVVDFEPFTEVELVARAGETSELVGRVPTEVDGHGEGDLMLPADFPLGYAELVARDTVGGEATMLMQVGDTPAVGPPAPNQPGSGQPGVGQSGQAGALWQDPSVLTLAALLGISGTVLLYVLFRGRTPKQASPALVARQAHRTTAHKGRRARRR